MKNLSKVPPLPLGMRLFVALFLAGVLYRFAGLLNFDYYRFMFQQLPERTILIRYIFSISFRLISFIIIVGLLARKDVFRKLAIGLCLFSILSTYWKHPGYVFNNIAILSEYKERDVFHLEEKIEGTNYPKFSQNISEYPLRYPLFPKLSMIFYCLIDITFATAFILYFSRSRIKKYFY